LLLPDASNLCTSEKSRLDRSFFRVYSIDSSTRKKVKAKRRALGFSIMGERAGFCHPIMDTYIWRSNVEL
jgi:hypothetical protein